MKTRMSSLRMSLMHCKYEYAIYYSVAGLSPEGQAKAILTLDGALIVVIFYSLTNGFQGVTIPAAFNVMIHK